MNQGRPNYARNPQKLGERQKIDSLSQPQKEATLMTSSLCNSETISVI